jgi:NAD(P)-dependent dehydrogenase (short-subunit alcohol dehydrogenase family)
MSRGRVHNKICLVTGAGSGIGKATAMLLAEEEATVIVTDIDAQAAEQIAGAIRQGGGRAVAMRLNVADESAWTELMQMTLKAHERLDVLVNNAGVGCLKPIAETTIEEWRRVQSVNLEGVFLGTKHAIDAMRRRQHYQRRFGDGPQGLSRHGRVQRQQGRRPPVLEGRRHRMCRREDGDSDQRRFAGRRQDPDLGLGGLLPELGREARRDRAGIRGDGGQVGFARVFDARGDCPDHPVSRV